jgi:integrase
VIDQTRAAVRSRPPASSFQRLLALAFDPLRDKTYQSTRLGRSVVDFLAWKELGGAADRTLDQYERDLARGCLMFPAKGLADITDGDMLQIARQYHPGERRTRMAAWRSFYRWALKTRQGVTMNPCDALPDLKRSGRKVKDIFTDPEITALCGLTLRDGALMQILFDAGIRKGDARRLRLGDLRTALHRVELVILNSKGKKDRIVPATTTLTARVNELALLEGLEDGDYLWYGIKKVPQCQPRVLRDRPVGEGTWHRWWERCIQTAGVRYRNPHMARHTFATRYLRMGGSAELLKEALGHKSIQTTIDLYVHMDTRDLHDEFERIFA